MTKAKSPYPVKPTIVIDTREKPHSALFQESSEGDKDVRAYIREKIDAGDYTIREIPNLVVVEKKKIDGKELYGNFILKRDVFMKMIARMRAFKVKYIIILQTYAEFLDAKNWTFVNPYKKRFSAMAMVESWLVALQRNEGISFIFAGQKHAPRLAKKILLKNYEYERRRLAKLDIEEGEEDGSN